MFDRDKWLEIWATLAAKPLRTFLTALGVFWGIFMLIVMLTFGSMLTIGSKKQMAGLSSNALFVWGNTTSKAFEGMQPGRRVQFDTGDIAPLRNLAALDTVAPRLQLGGFMVPNRVRYGTKSGTFSVMADYPQILNVINLIVDQGRFINELDIAHNRKVCVIGKGVLEQLYPEDTDPIGTAVEVNGVYFQVVGVVRSLRTGNMGDRDNNSVTVPFTTFGQAFNTGDRVGFFALTAKPGTDGPTLEREIRHALAARHRVDPEDDLAIGSFNAFVRFRQMTGFFVGLNLILWVVGVATLLAGVIGVANIMLITVKERTREFGLRKALGAKPFAIVAMVVKEAVVLTAVAGIIGITAGIGIDMVAIWFVAKAGPSGPFGQPQLAFSTVLFAGGILVAAGALAGVLPAIHAVRIKPVEALRAE